MSIKTGRQFRSYIISWFLMIVGLIVFFGSSNIFERAQSYVINQLNNELSAQLNTLSLMIDPKVHQTYTQHQSAQTSNFKRAQFALAQTPKSDVSAKQYFSLNLDIAQSTLKYALTTEKTSSAGLLVESDYFKIFLFEQGGKVAFQRLPFLGHTAVDHQYQITLKNGETTQLLVNNNLLLTIAEPKKLTAQFKTIKLNRWSVKQQLTKVNLPSPITVAFRYVPKDSLLYPPGTLFFAEPEIKQQIVQMMKAGNNLPIQLNKLSEISDYLFIAHLEKLKNSSKLSALFLNVPQSSYKNIRTNLLNSALLIFSLMSVCILIASMFFARKITGPLEQLNKAIARLISNDFNFQLSTKGFGSFKFLADQFNQMLTHIQKSRSELIALNKSYHRFVPHGLLKQLGVSNVKDISLGDCCEKQMTVLFCDIRGFTTLSESMTPQANFNFINRYLSQIAPVINKHGGIIDKYMGDGIMALFPNGADAGLQAAIDMLAALDRYNEKLRQKGLPIVEVGLGLHSGSMMLGTVGTSQRMDATVVSDTVNAASRVESMTKSFATKILITEETKRQLNDLSKYRMRYIAASQIRGKSKPVTLYEVFNNDTPSLQKEKAANQTVMIKAWKAYTDGDVATAVALYQRQIEKSPNDKSLFALIERCQYGRL